MKRFPLFCCLLMVAGMADAQSQVQPKPQSNSPAASTATKPTQSHTTIEPSTLRDAGLRMAQAIDAEQAGQLWDRASGVTKRAVSREAFVAGVGKTRKPLGAALGRDWIAVHRQNSAGGAMPPGQYASAEFAVMFAGNRVAREMVSFRLDEDGVWRFAGYVIR